MKPKPKQPRLLPALEPIGEGDALAFADLAASPHSAERPDKEPLPSAEKGKQPMPYRPGGVRREP